jgi:hypothetical protein
VAFARTDVSEESSASIVKFGKNLVAAYDIPSSLVLSIQIMEAICSFETLVITRATRHHIPEEGIFLATLFTS